MSGQFSHEHQVTGGSHPSYRYEEPPSPKTEIKLLTGGLLVRIQPEEPFFQQLTVSARACLYERAVFVPFGKHDFGTAHGLDAPVTPEAAQSLSQPSDVAHLRTGGTSPSP